MADANIENKENHVGDLEKRKLILVLCSLFFLLVLVFIKKRVGGDFLFGDEIPHIWPFLRLFLISLSILLACFWLRELKKWTSKIDAYLTVAIFTFIGFVIGVLTSS